MDFQPRSSQETNSSHFRPFVFSCPKKQARFLGCPGEEGNGYEFPFSRVGRYLEKDLSGGKAHNVVVAKYCGWKGKHTGQTKSSARKGSGIVVGDRQCSCPEPLGNWGMPGSWPWKLWSDIKWELAANRGSQGPSQTDWTEQTDKCTRWFASTFSLRSAEQGHFRIFSSQ